jgi:hypothetical protein
MVLVEGVHILGSWQLTTNLGTVMTFSTMVYHDKKLSVYTVIFCSFCSLL